MWIIGLAYLGRGGTHATPRWAFANPPCNPPRTSPRCARRRALRVLRSGAARIAELQEFRAGFLELLAVLGVHEVQAVLVDDLDLHPLPFRPARRADAAQHLLLEGAGIAHAPRLRRLT